MKPNRTVLDMVLVAALVGIVAFWPRGAAGQTSVPPATLPPAIAPTPAPPFVVVESTLAFDGTATVDFSGFAPADFEPEGPPRWVLVYVNGELHMLPVFKAFRVVKPNPRRPAVQ